MFNRSASSFLPLDLSLSGFNIHSTDRPVAGIDFNLVDLLWRNDDEVIDEKTILILQLHFGDGSGLSIVAVVVAGLEYEAFFAFLPELERTPYWRLVLRFIRQKGRVQTRRCRGCHPCKWSFCFRRRWLSSDFEGTLAESAEHSMKET